MAKIIRHTDLSGDQFINLLNDQEIVVMEDLQGSKIYVSYDMDWIIRPKSANNYAINMVDLAIQKFYKYAYAYLISLPSEVTDLLHPNWQFCFEYFPDEQPANIAYDRKPKNNLVLTCICKYGKYYSYDLTELKVFADLFGVETLPQIYKGKLSEKQIKAINFYLHTGEKDLELFYKQHSFAEFFYKLLNPQIQNSYLKNGWQENMEKIIIRFLKNDCEITLEILNPMYQKMQLKTDSEFSDVYSILLFNFIQWLQTIDISKIDVKGTSRDIIYINLISKLYNMYIEKYHKNIKTFEFSVPTFFNQDKFKINQDLIQNKTTHDWINQDPKFEYVFKILLSSFQRERKKPIGVINEIVLTYYNRLVRKLQIRVEEILNWNHRLDQFSYQQKDLSQFPNIVWQSDDKGYSYPEIGKLFGSDEVEEEKKKKSIKKGS